MNSYLIYMILVESADRFRCGTKLSIHSAASTGMNSFWNEILVAWYNVNEYRYLVWNQDEVVPGWNSIRYHVNTAFKKGL